MVDLSGSAQHLYRRLVGAAPAGGEVHPGVASVTDGVTAAALTEAGSADAAALGATFPAAAAGAAFAAQLVQDGVNLLGRAGGTVESAGPRGDLAAALGMATAGLRTAAFLSGPDLSGALDLWTQASVRRLPVVVHLAARAGAGPGAALGSGHDALHAAARSGAAVLVAANVQEVSDFALIARRTAEEVLAPALVAMDAGETALSVQEVNLPARAVAQEFLGDPRETIHAPTPGQEMLFGKHRQRVPRWHDLERPLSAGGPEGTDRAGLADAARRVYFDEHLPGTLERSFEELARVTGRRHHPVSAYRTDDARMIFMAMGSAVETAESVADQLRAHGKVKAGVIGVRVLSPFPAGRVVELLAGKKLAIVLERAGAPGFAEPPLTALVRSALERARENARHGAETHPGLPSPAEKDLPRLAAAFYGIGGYPLRAGDLTAAAHQLMDAWRSPVHLGIDFAPGRTDYPKRQILHDALRRAYPEASTMGLRAAEVSPDVRPAGSVTVDVHRAAGSGGEGVAGEAAILLVRAAGGRVRTRPGLTWKRFGGAVRDRLTYGLDGLKDPGDDVAPEGAVWIGAGTPVPPEVLDGIRSGGFLLVARDPASGGVLKQWGDAVRRAAPERNLKLYAVAVAHDAPRAERDARVTGALLGILKAEGRVELNPRKVTAARKDTAGEMPDGDPALAGFEEVALLETAGAESPDTQIAPGGEPRVPAAVRRLGKVEDTMDSLPRFWDQVGVLERDHAAESLAPDPYLGVGAVPPLASSFADLSAARTTLPAFDPALCTACGACWSDCPDGAIEPAVLSAASLIEFGMARAREHGRNADALRMAASKLAARVNQDLAARESAGAAAGPLFETAFANLMEKMPLPEDRKAGLREAFDAVRDEIATLPVARTKPFFEFPERSAKGSGELVALAVNPEACKGCGVCVAVCEPGALTELPQSADRLTEARALHRVFENLPETASATVELACTRSDVGPLAADLLTRPGREILAGGDPAEPGSGERIAVRQVLGTAAAQLKPRLNELLQTLEKTQTELADTIREAMAGALPTGDLDALARGLDRLRRPDADLAELSTRIEAAFETGRVDVTRLRRLVEAARRLADLHWRLTRGESGAGRASFGVVVGPGTAAAWAGAFPENPFAAPVTVDATGDSAEVARGILEGQLREAVEGFAAIRRARVELDRPAEVAEASREIARLTWRDLTPEERSQCPPLFLVVNEDALTGPGLAGFVNLLDRDLPVKWVLLSEAHLGLAESGDVLAAAEPSSAMRHDVALFALAHPRAYVLQTSIAHPEHLERGVAEAVAFDGPALIRLHAPSPERHGFPTDQALVRAWRAVAARVFPLIRRSPLDPIGERPRVDIGANPDPAGGWAKNQSGEVLTPAAWAAEEARFAAQLTPIGDDVPDPTPLIDYLKLSAQERKKKTPTVGGSETAPPLRVSAALVRAVEERLAAWRTLQELAGAALPPAALEDARAEALAALRDEHATALEKLRAEYEARVAETRDRTEADLTQRVRGRLLALAGTKPVNGGGKETT
jgi:pyruvate-ferredoxin/flavodoxin oxidoreductase